ncbi:MAG TPA: ATP-binding protein [Methylomirabilota bacterium]|nr:ATP-binding protein [Methylomirabilota bacterium]
MSGTNSSNFLEPRSLLEVVPKKTIQALLQSFLYQKRTGMVLIYDELQPDGSRRFQKIAPVEGESDFANFNPFCRAFRESHARHNSECDLCDMKHLGRLYANASESSSSYRYRCHMHLWDAFLPVWMGGKVRGGIYAGQRIATGDSTSKAATRRRLQSEFNVGEPLLNKLTDALEEGSEEEDVIARFWESFEKFAETFQVTVDAMFNAWQLKQTLTASVTVNQQLVAAAPLQNTPASDDAVQIANLFQPLESLLDVLEQLTGSPLWFLVRRGSRYRAEVASSGGRRNLPFQLKVANLIEFEPGVWHVAEKAIHLARELAELRPSIGPQAQFFRVDSVDMMGNPLSVVLLTGAAIAHGHRLIVESALRAIAYPIHISLLLQRQRNAQEENEKHFAFMGHHLKQPLSVVCALAWRLAHSLDSSTPHQRQAWADELMEKSRQALDDALVMQTAGIAVPSTVEIAPMLAELLEDRQIVEEGEDKRVRFEFFKAPRVYGTIRARAANLRIALANLIDNAVKYSWERETVILRLQQLERYSGAGPKPRGVVVTIENCGEGFSPQQKKLLYQIGGRIKGKSVRHVRGGFGLGLIQAKNIIEDYGGTIDIDSDPLSGQSTGNGKYRTVVKLTLPTDQA